MPLSLPLPPEDLARKLSRPLAPRRDGLELSVADPTLVETGDDPKLRLRVTVTTARCETPEHWQVTIPLDPVDLDPAVNATAFATTLRANLEEWWDMKDRESRIAAWGRRLGPEPPNVY
ncbi:MAG: hypothetical protein JO063_09700 [Pseudonocardiales bacterium]|nr:hypothetical protein [Pseudonocardiales bacterium]MBV9031450.1 hypothetical protein [Pseudonocardiales bacterium]MBW0010371.1 hypothetical protein [Pseudonocardiales bacterium]